jgi:hypothetical protein
MEELLRQLALQAADDQDADPYQLGYHLCTVARSATQVQNELLSHSLAKLFEFLRQDGTFARGNPVWSSDRGEFHCLTAELLAHTVISFKPRHRNLLVRELPHLERAVDWLEDHCIERIDRSRVRRQWSTGSRVGSFPGPDPDKRVRLSDLAESRSTSITYSFFHLLDHLLSDEINAAVFHRFGATYPTSPRANSGALSNSNLYGSTEVARSGQTLRPRVNEVIQRFLCDELKTVYTELPGYTLTDWADKQRKVRSVMLFGPPGTGKSTLAKGCAKYLGWPFLVLDPSVFSSLGLEMVPQRSIEVFRDLAELENVVLLFDEMDELIRERKSKADDRETDTPTTWYVQRLWTTVFLPRLQELHDRAGTVFFFATNFEKAEVDEAVRRPGRFDILMAMPHATRADKKTFLSKTLRSALSLECDRLARAIDSSESQKREECRVAKNTAVTWDVWLGALTNGDVRAYCDELLRVEVGTVGENNVWKTLFEAAHYVIPESAKDSSDYDFEANRFPPSVARSVFEEDRSEWGL